MLNYGKFYLKCYKNSSLSGPNDLTTIPFALACKLSLETTRHMIQQWVNSDCISNSHFCHNVFLIYTMILMQFAKLFLSKMSDNPLYDKSPNFQWTTLSYDHNVNIIVKNIILQFCKLIWSKTSGIPKQNVNSTHHLAFKKAENSNKKLRTLKAAQGNKHQSFIKNSKGCTGLQTSVIYEEQGTLWVGNRPSPQWLMYIPSFN